MRDDLILLAKMVWVLGPSMMLYLVPMRGMIRLCAGVELGDVGEWGLTWLSLALVVLTFDTFVWPGEVREFIVLNREALMASTAINVVSIFLARGVVRWLDRKLPWVGARRTD